MGEIRIVYEDGTSNIFGLIMGLNIAEWAYNKPEDFCCMRHSPAEVAYSFFTNLGSDYLYEAYNYYVSIETQSKPLSYMELILAPASYSQPDCPGSEECPSATPGDWFGIGIQAITLEKW